MSELARAILELKKQLDEGIIDQATYQLLLNSLVPQPSAHAAGDNISAGDIKDTDAAAIGRGAVAVGAGATYIRGNVYHGEPTNDPAEALRIYREVVLSASGNLPLRGLTLQAADASNKEQPFNLANVYVTLNTTQRQTIALGSQEDEEHEIPVTALYACGQNQRLVLLGDPGGGKSTFVNHLAYSLAAHQLQKPGRWVEQLTDDFKGLQAEQLDLIPLTLTLRDFAAGLPDPLPKGHYEPINQLVQFIGMCLRQQQLAFVHQPLQTALEQGRVLILFDGLDEVAATPQRQFVRDAVAQFAHRYPKCRYVVTCRVLSYQTPDPGQPNLRLNEADFPTFELAPFDEEQRDRFVEGWYEELVNVGRMKPDTAAGYASRLKTSIHRPDLWKLAGNPLLLTIMALVHTDKNHLPHGRAELYNETIKVLLWRWESVKLDQSEEEPALRRLMSEANRADFELVNVLAEVAFTVHQQMASDDDDRVADIGLVQLYKALEQLHPERSHGWAQQVVKVMKQRAGLLVERVPGTFSFPHRTFQEYLAGMDLADSHDENGKPDFPQRGTALADQPQWRIVILLAVGYLTYVKQEPYRILTLLGELCPREMAAEPDEATWRQVWLAAEAILEMGIQRVQDTDHGRELFGRIRERLVRLITEGHLLPRERAEAGRILSELGDPRPGVGVVMIEQTMLPNLEFCFVPAGSFIMGSRFEDDPNTQEREIPQHELEIPYDYWIARYPLTVAQYRLFVEATKHDEYPLTDGDADNKPVRLITWDDSLAFCKWLNERWALTDLGFQVTLPSEAEWEKAARGGLHIPAEPVIKNWQDLTAEPPKINQLILNPLPNRIYVWGNEADPLAGNVKETGLNSTCAVGAFPRDCSPYGCFDMGGNLNEWTRCNWGPHPEPTYGYPYQFDDGREELATRDIKILRGGGWRDRLSNYPRCGSRRGLRPFDRFSNYGVRLVLIPTGL